MEDEEPAVTVLIILLVPLMTPRSQCPSSSQSLWWIGTGEVEPVTKFPEMVLFSEAKTVDI